MVLFIAQIKLSDVSNALVTGDACEECYRWSSSKRRVANRPCVSKVQHFITSGADCTAIAETKHLKTFFYKNVYRICAVRVYMLALSYKELSYADQPAALYFFAAAAGSSARYTPRPTMMTSLPNRPITESGVLYCCPRSSPPTAS